MQATPGRPGTGTPSGKAVRLKVLGHHDPGGPSGDVSLHKGYAYIGSWGFFNDTGAFCPARGVRVYDLSNPRDPQHVSTFADEASTRCSLALGRRRSSPEGEDTVVQGRSRRGQLPGLRSGGFTGIGLYDVTDPENPTELMRQSGIFGVHELWLEARGRKAYVYEAAIFHEVVAAEAGEDPATVNPEFRIVDVSDPANPVQVGDWSAWRDMGVSPLAGQGSFPFNVVHSVVVERKVAYVSYWDFGTMLDVRTRRPGSSGGRRSRTTRRGLAHSAWTAREEDPHPDGRGLRPDAEPRRRDRLGLRAHLRHLGQGEPGRARDAHAPEHDPVPPPGPGDFTIHDPKVRGNKLYTSWYTEGVVIWNIANPASPTDRAVRPAREGRGSVRDLLPRRGVRRDLGRRPRAGLRGRVGHEHRPLGVQGALSRG